MNDRQISSFLSVVQNRSFSAAAERQFISPQALIQQINLLESEIGVKLLLRTNKGVSTTPAGERFYHEMLRISGEINELTLELRKELKNKKSLNIGLFEDSQMIPRICAQFAKDRPDVAQRYVLVNSEEWLSGLKDFESGRLDILEHVELPDAKEYGLQFAPVERISSVCVMESSHPLAQKNMIHLSDLDGQTVGIHHESCVRGFADALARQAPHAFLKNDARGKAAAFDICANGGVFIVSENFGASQAPLTVVPLQPEYNWTFGLLYPKECDPVVEDFVRCARNVCRLKME